MNMTNSKAQTRSELRDFGLIMGSIVALLFGLLLPWLFSAEFPFWPWIVAGIFVLPGLLFPQILAPVYKVWMAFGHVMGWINTRLILGIMFYLIILPIGLMLRLFGKDPMHRKTDPTVDSYREIHPDRDKKHFERPF